MIEKLHYKLFNKEPIVSFDETFVYLSDQNISPLTICLTGYKKRLSHMCLKYPLGWTYMLSSSPVPPEMHQDLNNILFEVWFPGCMIFEVFDHCGSRIY